MSQVNANELRKGMLVEVDGKPCTIMYWNIWKSDRRSRIQMKFKDVLTGRTSEATAQSDDRFTVLDSEIIDLEHSYRDGPEEVFYSTSGEEYRCPSAAIEDVMKWKTDMYRGRLVDGHLLTVSLPTTVVAVVAETEPAIKGAGSGLKDATLENGIQVKVGLIVGVGDKVRIDPETMEYRERVQ